MLFVREPSKHALFIPLAGLLASLALLGAFVAYVKLPITSHLGGIAWVVVGLGLVVLALAHVRSARIVNGRLLVRSLFGREDIKASSCVLGVDVSFGPKGRSHYSVYAHDGLRRAVIASGFVSAKRADRAVARLERALIDAPDGDGCAAARDIVAARRSQWEANFASAQAYVDTYYRSTEWKRAKVFVLGLAGILFLASVVCWFVASRP